MALPSTPSVPNIVLVGFSYTGKTTYGKLVAQHLGWRFVDTDDVIVERAGKSIPEIFAEPMGEQRFRQIEREVLAEVCEGEGTVIATGGGAITNPDNRRLLAENAAVICLESQPATIEQRLRDMSTDPSQPVRPLLAHPDPLQRIRELKSTRQPLYAIADWTVHTDDLTPEEAIEEIVRGARYAARRLSAGRMLEAAPPSASEEDVTLVSTVKTPTASYPIYGGGGILPQLGGYMRKAGLKGKVGLIADENLSPAIVSTVVESLRAGGDFAVHVYRLPAGEASKSLRQASALYDWLLENRMERGDAIVALGGGVTGDLAGYVAATYLRGVPFAQAPTTVLAMADASIGGKVAVDHPKGKNLIGAFYQPALVLADMETLRTLPERPFREGFAEVIKTALILDADLFDFLEESVEDVLARDEDLLLVAIGRCMELKGWVVSQDEKESGLRAILNYGHTLGHALEAATGYGGLLHGEAVSIGMAAAGELSRRAGLLSAEELVRQNALLERFGLPTRLPAVDIDTVLDAMALDKKARAGSVQWVMLEGIGKASQGHPVDMGTVRAVVEGLRG